LNTKYTEIIFPVKNIGTKEQLEGLSTLAMQELPTFLKEIQLRPGVLASSPTEDVLMPSVVNSSTIAISPGVGVTNKGNIIEFEEELRVTGITLGSYLNQTLFIEFKEILTSDITTIHKITGNDTNASYIKDQTYSALSWKSSYDPTTDEDDKIPIGKLIPDPSNPASYVFQYTEGYRRIFLLDIRFIEEGHYSGEFTKSVDQFTTLYNLLACKGHAPKATNNPSGMSTRDISHGIETFAALIDVPGIPTREFEFADNKDYLKVGQGTNAGTIKILAGEFIDINGRRVVVLTDQDNITVPADSNTYNVWIVYTTDSDDEDSFAITVSVATSSIALKVAEVSNNGLTVSITDTRVALKCRTLLGHYIPPDLTHVRVSTAMQKYQSKSRTALGQRKQISSKFAYITVKWGDTGNGNWTGNTFEKSTSEETWVVGEFTAADSEHASWYLYDVELDQMFRIIANSPSVLTVAGSGAIGIDHKFRILLDVDKYEIQCIPELSGEGGVKEYQSGQGISFPSYPAFSPPDNEVILRNLDVVTKYKIKIRGMKGIYYNEQVEIEKVSADIEKPGVPTNLTLTTGLEDTTRRARLRGRIAQFTGKAWVKAEWNAVTGATGYVTRLVTVDPDTGLLLNKKENQNMGLASDSLTEAVWHGLEPDVTYQIEVAALGDWYQENQSDFTTDTIVAGSAGKEFGRVSVPVACTSVFDTDAIAISVKLDGTILTTPIRPDIENQVGSIEVIYTESEATSDPDAPDFDSRTQPALILPPDNRQTKIPIGYGRKGRIGLRARDKFGRVCKDPILKSFSSTIPTLDDIDDGTLYKRVDGLKVGRIDDLLTSAGTKSLISERMLVATATDGTLTNKLIKTIRIVSSDCGLNEYFDNWRFPEDVKIWGMSIFSIQSDNANNGRISILYDPGPVLIVTCAVPDDQKKDSAVASPPVIVTGGTDGVDLYLSYSNVDNNFIAMVTIYYEMMSGGADVVAGGI